MAERPNQNWEARDYTSWGVNYGMNVNHPGMNGDGTSIFSYYGYTENKDVNLSLYSSSGTHHQHNDRTIEMVAGANNSPGEVDIVIAGAKGDITVTCMENGVVRIKGASIMCESDEDIEFVAGRNISFKGKNGGIKLDGQSVDVNGLSGNLVEATVGSWLQRVTEDSFIGLDTLKTFGAVAGIGDIPVVSAATEAIKFFSK